MEGRFANETLYKFPRMSSDDTYIWRMFLSKYGKDYTSFDYDFKVGRGSDPGDIVDYNLRQDFIELSRKRIDAIGYQPDGITIFEVKPRAGTQALGQLIIYKQLYSQDYPTVKIKSVAVVCGFITDEEIELYKLHDINIFTMSN